MYHSLRSFSLLVIVFLFLIVPTEIMGLMEKYLNITGLIQTYKQTHIVYYISGESNDL
jgi:hypothetical protein